MLKTILFPNLSLNIFAAYFYVIDTHCKIINLNHIEIHTLFEFNLNLIRRAINLKD
jgi:hypothetical protein